MEKALTSQSVAEPVSEAFDIKSEGDSSLHEASNATMFQKKLAELQKEKEELQLQLARKRKAHEKQIDAYIARYVNADFWLTQLNTILPAKKVRPSKLPITSSQSPQHLGCDDSLIDSMKLFEPATNLVYRKMHGFAKDAQTRVRQSNDDLLAWKFNPESASGKRMMGRIRQLLSENEKLGQFNHADRIATLESDAELQSTCIKEFIKTHTGIESVLDETYLDLEGLQNSLLMLHQQIDRAETVVTNLQSQLEEKQPGRATELMAAVLVQLSENQSEYESTKLDEVPAEAELDEKSPPPIAEKLESPQAPPNDDS